MNLAKLNSATKYPSILTYHTMGDKGRLQEKLSGNAFQPSDMIVTEKIDGTNARIIITSDGDCFLGSREDLLWAKGDRIGNPALGIVNALKDVALDLSNSPDCDGLTIVYGELYGGKITKASKQYTTSRAVGFRVFDIASLSNAKFNDLQQMELAQISGWRSHTGPSWYTEEELQHFASVFHLDVTPRVQVSDALPSSIIGANDWLKKAIGKSLAALDTEAPGNPEGVVVRSADRSNIAKLRFSDYRKALK